MKTTVFRTLKNKSRCFIACGCLLGYMLTASCDRGVLLNQSYDTPEPWPYSEPVCFDLMLTDTAQRYDLTFSVKHTEQYAWMNAFFLVTTIFPDMNTTIDTLECLLARPNGKWLGNKFGKFHQIGFLYKQGIAFPLAGEYRFEVRHAMRNDSLSDITAIGMKISPTR